MKQITTARRFVAEVQGKPCSTNRMWGRNKGGGVYLTPEAATWEMAVLSEIKTQLDTRQILHTWMDAGKPQVEITVTFYGVRGDVDNYLKSTLDGLKAAIGIDDRQFSPVTAQRGVHANGRAQPLGARIELMIPDPATPVADADAPAHPSGSLRASDLMDVSILEEKLAKYAAGDSVRVSPAVDYGAIFVMFPPSSLNVDGQEWGTFVSMEHARQLRDLLNAMPELAPSVCGGA